MNALWRLSGTGVIRVCPAVMLLLEGLENIRGPRDSGSQDGVFWRCVHGAPGVSLGTTIFGLLDVDSRRSSSPLVLELSYLRDFSFFLASGAS